MAMQNELEKGKLRHPLLLHKLLVTMPAIPVASELAAQRRRPPASQLTAPTRDSSAEKTISASMVCVASWTPVQRLHHRLLLAKSAGMYSSLLLASACPLKSSEQCLEMETLEVCHACHTDALGAAHSAL